MSSAQKCASSRSQVAPRALAAGVSGLAEMRWLRTLAMETERPLGFEVNGGFVRSVTELTSGASAFEYRAAYCSVMVCRC